MRSGSGHSHDCHVISRPNPGLSEEWGRGTGLRLFNPFSVIGKPNLYIFL